MRIRKFVGSCLVGFVLLLVCGSVVAGAQGETKHDVSSFARQVIELVNRERVSQGLPPLKENDHLDKAALTHSQAMADGDFMGHKNPNTGSTPGDRVRATGYDWNTVGENVATGQDTPAAVMESWLGSPGHRANILNPDFREIGVGYVFDAQDTFNCGDLPCRHYWTQNFGAQQDVYPLIINNEAFSTTSPSVSLYLYGQGWATKMRLRNDSESYSAWEPFATNKNWTLPEEDGLHRVSVELRNQASEVRTASDEIYLMTGSGAHAGGQNNSGSPLPDLSSTPTTSSGTTPQNGPDTVQIQRHASATSLVAGDEADVVLQVTGSAAQCVQDVVRTPLDIVLVIDHSNSMDDVLGGLFGNSTKLDSAKQASIAFLGAVELGTDRVAVVAFSDRANLEHKLDTDAKAIGGAINGIQPGGGTNIADGLLAALDELNSSRHRKTSHGVVVLLSDGQSAARVAAQQLKDAGVRIVTIGLGSDVDESELRQIASSPGDYYFSPDTSQLQSIFLSVARNIQEIPAAADVVIVHHFDATNFEIVKDSITPQGRVNYDRITWRLPTLGDETATFSYRVRSRLPGDFDLDLGDEVTYLRCGKEPRSSSLDRGLSVQIRSNPNATPTPVPTAVPVPVTPKQAAANFICGSFPWWFLLPFLAFLILLGLILWNNLWGIRDLLQKRRQWPRACQWLGILTLAYLAFLLGLLLHELQPVLCQTNEAIYFWQITPEGKSAILYKPIDPDLPVRQFKPMNKQATCIACHTTSLHGDTIAAIADGSNGPIRVMRLDGTPINIPPITGSYLSLSPDGRKLAYAAEGKDIHILDIESGATTPLQGASEPGIIETMPAWSPDGTTIAFVRAVGDVRGYALAVPCDIYTVPADGGVATLLPGAGGDGFNYYPAYSPDGRWLAFTRHTTGSTTRADPQAEIYLVPAQGGPAQRLSANDLPGGQTLTGVSNSWPTWSPDGRFLAFNSKRNANQFDIYVTQIDPSGQSGPARPLAEASRPDRFEHLPQWGRPPHVNLLARLLGLLPWLIPLLVLLLLMRFLVCKPKEYPPTVTLTREVSPEAGYVEDDTFNVRLTLTGSNATCDEVRVRKPVDVILVLDISGSMEGSARSGLRESKLNGAKAAARAFAKRMDTDQDRIGLVVFDETAEVRHSLDEDASGLDKAINDIRSRGGTAIHEGLALALEEMCTFRRAQVIGAIVLLSDGQSDAEQAKEQAVKIADENIQLITVAFGGDADRDLLTELASSPNDSHFSASNRQLERIFLSIAEQIQEPVAATDIVFAHQVNNQDFILDETSIYPRHDRIEGNMIIWRLADLGNNMSRTFRYQVRAKNAGEPVDIGLGERVRYRRCGDLPAELIEGRGLPVTVWEGEAEPDRPELASRKPPRPLELPALKPVWDPDAALIIGVGTFGREVLTYLKKNLRDAGAGHIPDRLQFLLVDTAKYMRAGKPLQFAGVHLDDDDIFVLDENLRTIIQEMLDSPDKHAELRPWFHPESYVGATQTVTLAEGTHGQRPLARAGLIRQVNGKARRDEETKEPPLFDRLTEQLNLVKTDQHGVHIFLAGSLSEGMGGVLWDLAYLVREIAGQELGREAKVSVEGYFGMEVQTLAADAASGSELNALCSLRELTWFQLNPQMPYRITYGNEKIDKELHPLRVRLVDDLYLFVDTPRSRGTILSPALADLITLRLDAKARGDRDWYDDQRSTVKEYEKRYHELYFATAGSIAVRLPAYDLIEKVKARWAREMIHAFLMGDTRGELAFSAQFADDPGLPADPAALVPGFLSGDWTGLDYKYKLEAPAPKALRVLGLSLENRFQNIGALSEEADEQAIGEYLDAVLNLILMGTTHEGTTKPRAGKIGYAFEFLEEIKNTCEGDLNRIVESSESWPNPDIQGIARDTKSILQDRVAKRLEQLKSVQENLGKVYDLIARREAALVEWQSEMDQLHGRLYLWQELVGQGGRPLTEPRDLADSWYEIVYQRAQPEVDAQKYLGWSLDSIDELQLQLKLGSAQDSTPLISDPEQFTEKLLAFTGNRVHILWDQQADLSALADQALALLVLRSGQELGDMNKTTYSSVEQWIRAKAAPVSIAHNMFSDVETQGSPTKRTMLARRKSTESPTVATLAALEQVLLDRDERQSGDQSPAILDLSDPLSWQFVRTGDVLSPVALCRYDRIVSQLIKEDEHRTVLDWEAIAKKLRGAFDGHALHPVVAACLVDEERARLYGLAYASGWVNAYDGEWGIRPAPGATPLVAWNLIPGWDAGVHGLLHFVYRADSGQVNEVKRALEQHTASLQDIWREKAQQEAWQQFERGDSADVRSLKLLAWYAMRKRIGALMSG